MDIFLEYVFSSLKIIGATVAQVVLNAALTYGLVWVGASGEFMWGFIFPIVVLMSLGRDIERYKP